MAKSVASSLKNFVFYRIDPGWESPSLEALQEQFASQPFVPCGPTQEASAGWVAPREVDASPMVERIGSNLIFKLMIEKKNVPGSAVVIEVERRCKQLELERGFAPGRKEKKELKEEVKLEMLPRAFCKRSSQLLWVDVDAGLLVVGASSHKAAEIALSYLVDRMSACNAVPTLRTFETNTSAQAAMAHWLTTHEAPYNFTVDREVELAQADSEQSKVKYSRHNLEIPEIVEHITSGKAPTALAMTFDSKVSFVLTAGLEVKKVELLDDVFVDADDEAGFDGDITLCTGELKALIAGLILALDGEAPARAHEE